MLIEKATIKRSLKIVRNVIRLILLIIGIIVAIEKFFR